MKLENEEISEPSEPNLPNMPKVVMEEILKNLDCPAIFRLRKVCRDLRHLIEEIKPELYLNCLSFELPLTKTSIKSYSEDINNSDKENYIHFFPSSTGCILEWNDGKIPRYSRISMEDGGSFLKNPKLILDKLEINLRFFIKSPKERIEKKEKDIEKFFKTMKSLLKNRKKPLKTKQIELQVHRLSEAADLLKHIDPKILKRVSIFTRKTHSQGANETNFGELEKLQQWKRAEELDIRANYTLTPVESFLSFKTVTVWVDNLSIEKLNKVKEFSSVHQNWKLSS